MITFNEERHAYEALTRFNYFPNQKLISEIPPCFTSRTFTPEISKLVAELPEDPFRRKRGYDLVEYHSTRNNNVPRTLSLIHPKPYSLLANEIFKNWENIKHIKLSENSMIKPDQHLDGRMIIMNYEDPENKIVRSLSDGFGKRFRAHTDISGCFSNIYTHSIPWAIMGFDEAKKTLGKTNHWSDQLDTFQRKAKRNETQGIPIGPATSSIIVEIILGKVDEILSKKFNFKRYIDDYTCFCVSNEEAESFISNLGTELGKYKLHLNILKTSIVQLPHPVNDNWVSDLIGAFPSCFTDESNKLRRLTSIESIHFLDFAIKLNKNTADGAVLKFAVGMLINKIDSYAESAVFRYLLNLSWHFPSLIPFIDKIINFGNINLVDYQDEINSIVIEHSRNRRSDGLSWSLYLIQKNNLHLSREAADCVLASKDCAAICVLYQTELYTPEIVAFSKKILDLSYYEKDQYWLLLYQLYYDGLLTDPYNDGCFPLLVKHNVNFMPKDLRTTRAEDFCEELNNPFRDDAENLVYEKWITDNSQ